ncbi:TetR/AcrR family transcriptional regulator [Streptomyces sp. NPDC048282]|uniref:TetR/AcrR family transcriptional regulator n=1 Tax=unclassified Streptomyces TaxID=2593676 RepID=UPI0037170850
MRSAPSGSTRQKPARAVGRGRDAARDRMILDAVLSLLGERSPDALSMEAVAVRAGLSKSTVYRRWASVEDLVADAVDTLTFPVAEIAAGSGTLREDLVEGLIAASGCLDEQLQRIVATVLGSSCSQPALAENLRSQFVHAIESALTYALQRAAERGETAVQHRDLPLNGHDAIEVAVAVGLIINLPQTTGRPLARADFERIVDEALLPLLTA